MLVRRKDDEPEAVQTRLDAYRKSTATWCWTWYQATRSPHRDESTLSDPLDDITQPRAARTRPVIQLKSPREIEIMARGGRDPAPPRMQV